MSWTKRQLVNAAFEEIGYAVYNLDLQPEQLQGALHRMDAMLAEWYSRGLKLGYPLPSTFETSDLDQTAGVSDIALAAIYLNLSLRIAPMVGKSPSPGTTKAARQSKRDLFAAYAEWLTLSPDPNAAPAGQGNRQGGLINDPFLRPPQPDQMPPVRPSLKF